MFMPGHCRTLVVLWFSMYGSTVVGGADWQPIARQLPPAGISILDEDRQRIVGALEKFEARLPGLVAAAQKPDAAALVPDVRIFAKAVRRAVDGNEYYRPQDIAEALALLEAGQARLDELQAGKTSWTNQRGPVVRGYVSKIDGSVQPYGLVLPEKLDLTRPVPLYIWLHGRNDKLTDLAFLAERRRQIGQVKVDDAIVLHPYGRNCLGWKSAAEIDVLEAIESVAAHYPVDLDRVVLMGFSMGGAGAWHMGAHYAERWAAVHAGAGFVDVARYQHLQPEQYPPVYEQALWGLYDVPDYARNLLNVPVIAYSGEVDKQKDAADFMAEVLAHQGHTLTHLIGPGLGHKYDPKVWNDILERVRSAAAKGRDRQPSRVSLQTRTLRYGKLHWVEALGLEAHWRDARIDAERRNDGAVVVQTRNITRLRLTPAQRPPQLRIDDQPVQVSGGPLEFERRAEGWRQTDGAGGNGLRKVPELQGPIDDAFVEPFLVVLPTGKTSAAKQRWIDFELAHFQARWRDVYRGDLRIKRDVEVTDDDLTRYHVVAWGDADSNAIIRRAAAGLPVCWQGERLAIGQQTFATETHLPLLIYPNPLRPDRYLVLNSGPTHREAHDRTNSLQNPKLPDWAIVDATVSPDAEHPGRVVAADFFDEQWQLKQ